MHGVHKYICTYILSNYIDLQLNKNKLNYYFILFMYKLNSTKDLLTEKILVDSNCARYGCAIHKGK